MRGPEKLFQKENLEGNTKTFTQTNKQELQCIHTSWDYVINLRSKQGAKKVSFTLLGIRASCK